MPKISETSKRIISLLLKEAIKNGDSRIFFTYQDVMRRLGISELNYFSFCIQYLYDAKYLDYVRADENGDILVKITVKGIDFAEED